VTSADPPGEQRGEDGGSDRRADHRLGDHDRDRGRRARAGGQDEVEGDRDRDRDDDQPAEVVDRREAVAPHDRERPAREAQDQTGDE